MPSESTTKSAQEKAEDLSRAIAGIPSCTGVTRCSLCFVKDTHQSEDTVGLSVHFGIAMIDIPRRARLASNRIDLETVQSVLSHACGRSMTWVLVNFDKNTIDVIPYGFDPSSMSVRLQTHAKAGMYEIRRMQVHQVQHGMHRKVDLPSSLSAQVQLLQNLLEEVTAAADIAVLMNVNEMIKLWEDPDKESLVESHKIPEHLFAGALLNVKGTRI